MKDLYKKDLAAMASKCFGEWRLFGFYKDDGVYICAPWKECDPIFLDDDFVRNLIHQIRRDKSIWFRCMTYGLADVYYPFGIGEKFYEEMQFMSTCGRMIVEDRKGFTVRMVILILFALLYDFPVEYLSDRVGGNAHVQS